MVPLSKKKYLFLNTTNRHAVRPTAGVLEGVEEVVLLLLDGEAEVMLKELRRCPRLRHVERDGCRGDVHVTPDGTAYGKE